MENLVVSTKKKFTLDKFLSQVKVTLGSPVKKVLSVSSKTVVTSSECMNGFCMISGKINVGVIYLSAENVVEHAENVFDFIEKQTASFDLSDTYAVDTNYVESMNFSSTEVICMIAHHVDVTGIYKYELSDVSSENNDLVLVKKDFTALRLVSTCTDNFVIAEECETNVKNMNILQTNGSIIPSEVTCLVDKVVIDGKLNAEIIYRDEEGVSSINKEFEFKQEISADGVVPNMLISSFTQVRNVTVTPEENEDKTNLVFAFDVFAKGYIFEENTYESVTDMFSLKNEIQTTYDYIEAKNYDSTSRASENVLSSTNVSELENFDDIIGVVEPKFEVTSLNQESDKVYVTGNVLATALYKSGEETRELPVCTEVRFEVEKDRAQFAENVNGFASVVSYKVKAGKELEATFKLEYSVDFYTLLSEQYIKSFEVKGEKPEQVSGIRVYVTRKGETLFDVAKVLNVRPETITSQNDVQDIFEQGEKIYIYSPINLL